MLWEQGGNGVEDLAEASEVVHGPNAVHVLCLLDGAGIQEAREILSFGLSGRCIRGQAQDASLSDLPILQSMHIAP